MTETRDDALVVTVRSLKYDGRTHRSWRARLIKLDGPLITLSGVFEEKVEHPVLGRIRAGTLSTEYFWTDRWYSIFRFAEPSGEHRNFYCNVNAPPTLDGDVLSFVDLDVDLLVAPDFSFLVLDEDEFETHAAVYDYPPEFRARVREAVAELISLIERREFPFNSIA